ncbi:MAG: phosphotransferase [Acidimicrobiia bacterium]|nr:phosphotransferase [Acidimicrobiia bacterium]
MSDASDPPGPLLASGRAADVFDLGDGTVLRRYRLDGFDCEYEARVMRHVADAGIRVPNVVSADGADIVMERIDGPTMLDDLRGRQWMLFTHARRLARLQARLAAVAAPAWMLAPGTPTEGSSVLHLDLHPMNVLIADTGPVIIDWTNAAGGPPGFDAAISFVEMSAFDVADVEGEAGPGPDVGKLAQRFFTSTFRRARGGELIDAFLVAACDHRLADSGTTPGERVAIAELRKRALARRAG